MYTFIRTKLLDICNMDIDELLDDDDLETWHKSIDPTHPHSSKLLGFVLVLRCAAKLEGGTSEYLDEDDAALIDYLTAPLSNSGDSNLHEIVRGKDSPPVNFIWEVPTVWLTNFLINLTPHDL